MNEILVAIITGGLSAMCSVIAIVINSKEQNALQDERQRVMKEDIAKLAAKVEQHNNFGLQLAELKTRVDILERRG